MSLIRELWAVMVATATAWLSHIDNEVLNIVVNLLTIAVILIGLADWAVRKIRGRKAEKKERGRQVLELLESTQRPFKAVNMLDNPMGASENIGNFVDKITNKTGGKTMKNFFKWMWYNKEQLASIAFNVLVLALTNVLLFTNYFDGLFAVYAGTTTALVIKIVAAVLGVLFTALTVRNTCVKYGLSSLETIDAVLAERAEIASHKLTPEQKKTIKSYIATLQNTLEKAKEELATAETALAEITALFNADPSLVENYAIRRAGLVKQIEHCKTVVQNIENKIAEYKAQLDGKTEVPQA